MKSIIKNLALAAIVAMGATSCDEEKFVIEGDDSDGVVLLASTSSTAQSRVSFEEDTDDDDSSIISLTWEAGDIFTVYNSSDDGRVGNFTCTSVDSETGVGTFVSESGILLSDNASYTAIYPASTETTLELAKKVDLTSEQNGDEIDDLDNACYMEAAFSYSTTDGADDLTFYHKKAVMTFQFKSDDRPAKLVFENGEDAVYTVNYTDIEEVNGLYTSYIMIEPCDDTERTLIFSLYAEEDSDDPYDQRSVTSSVAYEAGVRYTSPVSDLENALWSGSGTEADPYIIENGSQLRTLSTNVNAGTTYSGKYFKMTNNIDLGGEYNVFTAIGSNSTKSFQGTFDGAGYEVSGLYISRVNVSNQGLFGYIVNATIKNLGVRGNVTGMSYTGGVVGVAFASTIINCYNTANVTATVGHVGGVVGRAVASTIVNCYNSASVRADTSGSGGVAGGIVGYIEYVESYNYDTVITNCYNTANLSGASSLGGIVGSIYNNSDYSVNISNCYYNSDEFTGGVVVGDNTGGTFTDCVSMTTDEMQSSYLTYLLNYNAYNYNETDPTIEACAWSYVADNYPTLDCGNTSPSVSNLFTGSGTSGDPYQISSGGDLRLLSILVNAGTTYSGDYFKMTKDIDLGGESNEFTAIGTSSADGFQGTFDGGGYEVSGLYINSVSYQGLFGYTRGATIKNVGVSGSIIGSSGVGGIIGYAYASTVINCYNAATIKDPEGYDGGLMGGIVGSAPESTIINCYNTAEVSGYQYIGGIVGNANCSSTSNGSITIANCYNTAEVSGTSSVGGIVGYANDSYTSDSYIIAVTNCYYNYDKFTGGVVGSNSGGTFTDCVSMTTDEMQSSYLTNMLNYNAYSYNQTSPTDKACAWSSVTNGYPTLDVTNTDISASDLFTGSGTSSDQYQISSGDDLRLLSTLVNAGTTYSGDYFKMTKDIDLGGESNEFTAIGTSSADGFQGTFDGGGYEVSGLYINQSNTNYQGLFGYIYGATIKNLGVSGEVTGSQYVGGVVGCADYFSTIINCYNTASVSGSSNSGGIVGYALATSTVTNCYNSASASVSGSSNSGGIVGYARTSTVTNCYNSASVSGSSSGGIVGYARYTSTITNCYHNSDKFDDNTVGTNYSTSLSTVTDCISMTTAQMQSSYLTNMLNYGAYIYNQTSPTIEAWRWASVTNGYPTLDYGNTSISISDFSAIFSAGSGTSSDSYKISSGTDLRMLSTIVAMGHTYTGEYFEMTDDIDLGGSNNEFTAIGSSSTYSFQGTFDGAGYEISGLYINQPNADYQALFGYTSGATIKNLGVSGNVTGNERVAGIVAYVTGTFTIEDCYNTATVTGEDYTGGVIGYITDNTTLTIKYCYNTGAVTGDGDTGGVVGAIGAIRGIQTISQCYNTGKVIGKGHIGGVIGDFTARNGTMDNCYNTGAIEGTSYVRAGGVAGYIDESNITNCYNAATVTSTNSGDNIYLGGVIGYISGVNSGGTIYYAKVSYCYYNSDNYSGSAIGLVGDYYTTTDVTSKTYSVMQSSAFVTTLNTQSSGTWTSKTGINDGYPILSWQTAE